MITHVITTRTHVCLQIRASLDKAFNELTRLGYRLSYTTKLTGWRATVSSLTCGLLCSNTPTQPQRGTVPGSSLIAANPMHSRGKTYGSAGLTPYTLIVRGATLDVALTTLREKFGAVCLSADSVICCRVTPKQKGLLVKLVKDAGHLTLAIGDGGNDVAMIQEAAVGIGIRGKEGLQASRASDYQVPYFRALQRLLLIHGRYSYYRTCIVAQYSFYKSFLFCIMQIGFGFFSGYAGM